MNKMFKKLMAVSATVAIAATMSVSAFADVAQVELKEDNTASVTVTPATAQADNAQYTVMLFKSTGTTVETIADAAPAAPTDIYYINQSGNVTSLVTDMLVKGASLPADTYVVRIGNDTGADVENILLTVTEETITIVYGDINRDTKVNAQDLAFLKRYLSKWEGYNAETLDLEAANIAYDGTVNAQDLAFLKRHLSKWTGYETLPIKK